MVYGAPLGHSIDIPSVVVLSEHLISHQEDTVTLTYTHVPYLVHWFHDKQQSLALQQREAPNLSFCACVSPI